MPQVEVTSYGHSTVRIRHDAGAIVIDPGALAPDAAFADATAFLVTHEHEDHVDVARLAVALTSHGSVHAWVPSEVARQLSEAGVTEEAVSVVTEDASFEAAGLAVRAFVGTHAEIYRTLPASGNVAYLIDGRLLHPGDAFPAGAAGEDVEVLFLPVSGPWMRFADAADYVEVVQPQVVVPIHDGDLLDLGRHLTDQMSALLPGQPTYRRLVVGVPAEL